MQIKNGAPPPPQTMAHKPRIVMPKSHKYKEKLSIHLPHGHVGIIANGYSRPLPYGLLVGLGRLGSPGDGAGLLTGSPTGFFLGGEYIAKECSQYHTNEFVCIICLRRIRSMRVNTLDGVGVFLKLSVVVRATAFTFSVETAHQAWQVGQAMP